MFNHNFLFHSCKSESDTLYINPPYGFQAQSYPSDPQPDQYVEGERGPEYKDPRF